MRGSVFVWKEAEASSWVYNYVSMSEVRWTSKDIYSIKVLLFRMVAVQSESALGNLDG